MGLFAVGRVPFRPIGKSHYSPAPWDVVGDLDYLPSVMSDTAMRKGLQKAMEPVRSYSPIQKARMHHFLSGRMRPIWFGDLVKSKADVVSDLNLSKSAGWPFYYQCDDKEDCLAKFSIEVWDLVERVLRGEYVPMYFSATLKDELRTKDRVAEEKTRVFNASGIVHLICSKILFSKQNEAIVNTRGMHPSTLGISVPGPEFVTAMLGLKRNCEEGDVSGCDLRLNLDCAQIVRDVRKESLPGGFHDGIDRLYDATFAGHTITEGVIYRLLHNKSGTENTISDTFLILWMQLWEAINTLRPDLDFDEAIRLLINGDDLATGIDAEGFGLKQISEYLAQYGTILEIVHSEKGGPEDITFLSNSLRYRFVSKRGDILVAAGNRAKLVASENFVKSSPELTFEESCLVHLLGLRVCLWPFAIEFEDIEDRINDYLKNLETRGLLSDRIRLFLRARITEEQILSLHVRAEDGLVLFPDSACEEVHKLLSLISCHTEHLHAMSTKQKKPNAAERAAQSARDKALNRVKSALKTSTGGKGKGSMSSGAPATNKVHPMGDSSMVVGTASVGYEDKFSMSEMPFVHPRHGPGVRLRGRELIQLVTVGVGGVPTGGLLANWDVSPSNLIGTRASALAALYEKYRFKIMQFEWSPECSSYTPGKVLLTYDPDCLDATPPASLAGLKAASSYPSAKDSTVWKPCAIRVVEKEDTLFFTNEVANTDARLIYQGQFYLMNGGATTLVNSTTGSISFAFELEFYKPALEQIGASIDLQFNIPTSNLRAALYSNPKQLFNAVNGGNITSLSIATAGGIQKLIDVAGNTFYRVPPGNYRIDLLTQEQGVPFASGTDCSLSAPTITAVIPATAPSGGQAPKVTPLNIPQFILPANSVSSSFTGFIQAVTEGAYALTAPSGADVYGNLGTAVNWLAAVNLATVGWEIDRMFGSQAITL